MKPRSCLPASFSSYRSFHINMIASRSGGDPFKQSAGPHIKEVPLEACENGNRPDLAKIMAVKR